MVGEPGGHEEVLAGGNMTAVVRVGDTVRRATGPWTPTIHAFMRHLRASGFTSVPEPLGIDDRGREIISLLRGAPATYPLPDFVWSDATLVAVARLLRAFHDASLGFVPPPGGRWQWPAHEPAEVICHNDFAPYNLMFEDGRLTGVIDLDLASPGPRAWDMAYTAYRFVPLTDADNPDALFPGTDAQARRLAAFCASYADPAVEPLEVLESAAASSASSSRSSSARPLPATPPSLRSWPAETSASTSATSLTSTDSPSADRPHIDQLTAGPHDVRSAGRLLLYDLR